MKTKIRYLSFAFFVVVNVIVGNLLFTSEPTLVSLVGIQQVSAELTGTYFVHRESSGVYTSSSATCPDGTKQSCLTYDSKCVTSCSDGGRSKCTPSVILTSTTTCRPHCDDD